MDWKDIGRSVANAAPALGVALGGPAGGAIGSIVAATFGASADPQAVSQAIQADPEAAVKLREIELRHAEVLGALAVQRAEAELLDVQHARATHRDHWMPWVLTLVLAAMVAGTVAALLLVETPKSNEAVIYLIAGQLIGAFATAVAYWLGSSRGSAEKQRVLEGRQ